MFSSRSKLPLGHSHTIKRRPRSVVHFPWVVPPRHLALLSYPRPGEPNPRFHLLQAATSCCWVGGVCVLRASPEFQKTRALTYPGGFCLAKAPGLVTFTNIHSKFIKKIAAWKWEPSWPPLFIETGLISSLLHHCFSSPTWLLASSSFYF